MTRNIRESDTAPSPHRLRPLRTSDRAVVDLPAQPGCPDWGARHVIVVDDDPLVGMAIEETLRFACYRVSRAHDGVDALEIHAADPADALVTDLNMPGLTGQDLIRRMHACRPDLPVVVLTGCPPVGGLKEVKGGSTAPMALIHKPVTSNELTDALAAVLTLTRLHTP